MSRKRRAEPIEDIEESDDDFQPAELEAVLKKQRLPQLDDQDDEDLDQSIDQSDDEQFDEEDDNEDDDLEMGVVSEARQFKNKRDPAKPFICNFAGLSTKLDEIALPTHWPWVERLSVTIPHPLNVPDVNDDLTREAEFYRATCAAVKVGVEQMKSGNVPYVRPTDYYAEMLKPDTHMARVKDALIREKSRMTAVALRKKQQDSRKFSKQTQVAKTQQKHAEKRAHMEGLKDQRKKAQLSETPVSEHSTVPGFDEAVHANKQYDKEKNQRKNHKRDSKNTKYGYGGKKKHAKTNDSESVRDMSDFKSGSNRKPFGGMSDRKPRAGEKGRNSFNTERRGGKAGSTKSGNRPGKSRRQGGSRK